MGCASGKKISSDSKSFYPSNCPGILQIQTPGSMIWGDNSGAGEAAPVSQVLQGEIEKPKAVKSVVLPKKTLGALEEGKVSRRVSPPPPSSFKPLTQEYSRAGSIANSPSETALASARNITGSKAAFDKGKYRLANMNQETGGSATGEETKETKPRSSLALSIRPQAPVFTGSGTPVIVRPANSLEATGASTQVSALR